MDKKKTLKRTENKKTSAMIMIILTLLVSLIVILANIPLKLDNIKAREGIIDISDYNLNERGMIELTGEWEFYPKKIFTPEDLENPENKPAGFINVPRSWNKFEVNNKNIGAFTTCTYRLVVNHKLNETPISIFIPTIYTNLSLWIDGKEVLNQGKHSLERMDLVDNGSKPRIINYTPNEDKTDIIINLTNSVAKDGGLTKNIILGTPEAIEKYANKRMISDVVIITSLFCIFIFSFIAFTINRKKKENIIFSIFCVLLSINILFTGAETVYLVFPNLPFEIVRRIEYLSLYLSFLFYFWITLKMIKEKYMLDSFINILLIICIIGLIAGCLLVPLRTNYYAHIGFSIFLLIPLIILVKSSLIAYLKKKKNSGLILFTNLVVLIIAFVNLYMLLKISYVEFIFKYGLVYFALSHMFLLIKINTDTFFEYTNTITLAEQKKHKTNQLLAKMLFTAKDVKSDINVSINKIEEFVDTSKDAENSIHKASYDVMSENDYVSKSIFSLKEVNDNIENIFAKINSLEDIFCQLKQVSNLEKNKLIDMRSYISSIIDLSKTLSKKVSDVDQSGSIKGLKDLIKSVVANSKVLSYTTLKLSVEHSNKGFEIIESGVNELNNLTRTISKEVDNIIEDIHDSITEISDRTNESNDITIKSLESSDDAISLFEKVILQVYELENELGKVKIECEKSRNVITTILEKFNQLSDFIKSTSESIKNEAGYLIEQIDLLNMTKDELKGVEKLVDELREKLQK